MVVCSYLWCYRIFNDLSLLRMKARFVLILVLLFIVVMPADAQCAMCRAVLESEEGQNTAKGVNDGIIYLMLIPYILVGGLGYFIYRILSKKSKTII